MTKTINVMLIRHRQRTEGLNGFPLTADSFGLGYISLSVNLDGNWGSLSSEILDNLQFVLGESLSSCMRQGYDSSQRKPQSG